MAALDATPAFIALESDLNALRPVLETADFEVAEDAAKALERSFRELEGADDVKKALGKAKKAMSKRKKDRETALKEYEKALRPMQINWFGVLLRKRRCAQVSKPI